MANKLLYGNCGAPTDVLRLTDQLVPAGVNRQAIQPNTTTSGPRNDAYTTPTTFDMQRLFDELQTFDSVSLAGDFVLQPNVMPPPASAAPILRAPDVATTLTSASTGVVRPVRAGDPMSAPGSRLGAINGQPTLHLRETGSPHHTRAALATAAALQRERDEVVERNLAQALGNNSQIGAATRFARDYLDEFDRRTAGDRNSLAERWAADYENSEFWRQLDREFEAQRNYADAYEAQRTATRSERPDAAEGRPGTAGYHFAARNPFLNELRSRLSGRIRPDESPIEALYREALRRFHAGDIPNAVLCFEAVLQADNTHVDAWHHLATAHSLNEDDKRCIQAALRALDLLDVSLASETTKPAGTNEPDRSTTALTVLMQLAVAYTNENQHNAALAALRSWIQIHPRHRRFLTAASNTNPVPAQQRTHASPTDVAARISSVDLDWAADMFFNETLAAIDVDPFEMDADVLLTGAPTDSQLARLLDAFTRSAAAETDNIDSDLYCGLGVLYSLNADFDRAIDNFRTALHQRPFDGLLWNRLGASLANGGRPEEAIQAYQKALQILPGLIRSRYNLAVAHLNLGQYGSAVQQLVHALREQRERTRAGTPSFQQPEMVTSPLPGDGIATAGGSPFAADSIWSLLRMAIRLDSRSDLYALCDARDIDALHQRIAEPRPAAAPTANDSARMPPIVRGVQIQSNQDEEFV